MKKLLTVLCLGGMLGSGMSAMAHDVEKGNAFTYSVFAEHMHMRGVGAAKIQATQQQAKALLPGWNATPDKLTGMFRDMYGPVVAVAGNTNIEKAQWLMAGKLAPMGINAAEWINTRDVAVGHASFVDFKQVVAGHEVVFSNLSFRFTPAGKLQRVKMQNYGAPVADMVPVITANAALNSAAMMSGISGVAVDKKEIEGDWVWFPIPTDGGYVIHPAWAFRATGTGQHEMPFDLTGYIDAITGELLYRANSVNETFEVQVKADLHLATPHAPTTEVLMSDMRVSIGSTNNTTDANGITTFGTVNAPASVTYSVRGPWSRTYIGGNTPEFTANMPTSPAVFKLPVTDTTTAQFRAVSAFFHVNKIHDFMKGYWPAFTGMDNTPLATNVDVSGATCNAFYSNGNYSINFYAPQTTCRAFSIVSDIVYHEYGHGICYKFYQSQNTNFQNGALGEAYADVWAMGLNRDGIVGDGAYISGGNIRSYLGAPKVYPTDIIGEVHADGEIIAGCWWDVAVNTGNIDTMMSLFTRTHYDLPNGPSGTEGQIYHDVLISALLNDDDDANLGNGTPHFMQIVEAFARHGIYLMADAEIEHKEVPHQKINTPVTIAAKLTLTNPAFFDKMYLHYRDRYSGGIWDSVIMTKTVGNEYSAQIPGFGGGTIIDYYFKAQDAIVASGYGLPRGYSPALNTSELTIPYQFGFGLDHQRKTINFEDSVTDWQLGLSTDNATGGKWVQAVPVGTTSSSLQVQPGADNTTGTGKCLVTGNGGQFSAVGDADVDNGKTTAVTPVFQLPFYQPVVEYYRWYSNDRGSNSNARSDYWAVEITNQGSMFWQRVDYTKESDQRWRRRIFRVSEFLPGATAIQMRFVAEDRVNTSLPNNGQNTVEAAVDDFIIYEGAPLGVEGAVNNVKAEVYPNPANDKIFVTVPAQSKGSITLYDVTGKSLQVVNIDAATDKYTFNTSGLASGTYMVLVQTQHVVQNATIVVNRN